MGIPSRAHRRTDLLRHHHSQPGARSLVGRVRDLAGWSRHLGRYRRRRGRRAVRAAPAPGPRRSAPVHGRRRPRPARRAGDRPDRELLQPGAVRQAHLTALGPGDLARAPAARLSALSDLPAYVPLRDDLEPVPGRGAAVAGPDPSRARARVLRPVRGGLLGLPDVRGDPPDRLLQPHPRSAVELLRRARAVSVRDRLVHGRPTGLARVWRTVR